MTEHPLLGVHPQSHHHTEDDSFVEDMINTGQFMLADDTMLYGPDGFVSDDDDEDAVPINSGTVPQTRGWMPIYHLDDGTILAIVPDDDEE